MSMDTCVTPAPWSSVLAFTPTARVSAAVAPSHDGAGSLSGAVKWPAALDVTATSVSVQSESGMFSPGAGSTNPLFQ